MTLKFKIFKRHCFKKRIWRHSQVVRQRSAKPLFSSSNLDGASKVKKSAFLSFEDVGFSFAEKHDIVRNEVSNLLEKYRWNKIIKNAVEETVLHFTDSIPHISQHFFYGAVDIGTENLVVWYLFKTDAELVAAKENGLCKSIEDFTIHNLVESGYPKEAFAEKEFDIPSNMTFDNGTEKQKKELIKMFTHRKASIAFTTEEDINKKANGDYYLYFK